MMYWAERSPPKVVEVPADTTRLMVAVLATAPDHSVSSTASISSLLVPGFVLLGGMITLGLLTGKPNRERNVVTYGTLILLSETMKIDSPVPSIPWFHKGVML